IAEDCCVVLADFGELATGPSGRPVGARFGGLQGGKLSAKCERLPRSRALSTHLQAIQWAFSNLRGPAGAWGPCIVLRRPGPFPSLLPCQVCVRVLCRALAAQWVKKGIPRGLGGVPTSRAGLARQVGGARGSGALLVGPQDPAGSALGDPR